jgi:hypothetical protein
VLAQQLGMSSHEQSQQQRDEYKINTVIAARRAFERSEERDQQDISLKRRQVSRSYETFGVKYCPCCRDKVSTGILLCNSGLMTVTAQVAVICTIAIATKGYNVIPNGLIAIFLLTCFAVAIFGLCGIIGPIRRTFSNPPQQSVQRKTSNFCILSYMLANITVLIIFFISLCVALVFLSGSAELKETQEFVKNEASAWMYSMYTSGDWTDLQTDLGCCGFNDTTYDAALMPEGCKTNTTQTVESCYEELVTKLWDNLNLLSGIMGFLFVLQLIAMSAACQLLCCAETRNQFSSAAQAAVNKLGLAMESARQDVQEDNVLLDSDYSSNSDSDHHSIELGTHGRNDVHGESLDSSNDELYSVGSDDDIDGEGNSPLSRAGSTEFNITHRSSGPDSSEESSDGRKNPRNRNNVRVSTYAQDVIDIAVVGSPRSEHSV